MRCWLLLMPLLAGCGVFGPSDDSPRAECEWQANKDPKVTDIELKQFTATTLSPDLRPDLAVARHEAMQRCLQARGLAGPGGVEPLRPRY